MNRTRLLGALVIGAVALLATGCLPNDPGPTGLYRGVQADIHPLVTPRADPIFWGSAPNIDEHYGGTLYDGTVAAMPDPRPDLLANGNQPLRMWMADPDDGRTGRPAILWFHGGGFAFGLDSMYGLAGGTAKSYAQRGYVGFSVEYRSDTTLVDRETGAVIDADSDTGNGRPPALCQWVQDNYDPNDQVWLDNAAHCRNNVQSALADALAAVRYVRAHATEYGIDPEKIAIGGFSAGGVISDSVAFQHENVGSNAYWEGDTISVDQSKVQASINASGCLPGTDWGFTGSIGAGDAPTSGIQSKFDQAMNYSCVAATVTAARAQGLTAELTSYCGDNDNQHANNLYQLHRNDTDVQWTTFLARELQLYGDEPPPTANALCT